MKQNILKFRRVSSIVSSLGLEILININQMIKEWGQAQDDDIIFRDLAVLFEQVIEKTENIESQDSEVRDINEESIPMVPQSLKINQTPFNKTKVYENADKNSRKLQQKCKKTNWLRIWYDQKSLQKILNYCNIDDWLVLMKSSRWFQKQIQIIQLRFKSTWCFSRHKIEKCLQNDIYFQYSSIEEESQHSLDLDRTVIFLQSDHIDHQLKLDRVLRALSFSIGYFQGLNSIAAVLLQFYKEQEVYWFIRLLLHKSNNLQNNSNLYSQYIQQIDNLIKTNQPEIYEHLQNNLFNVEYFVMRWVLALFSYDSEPQLLLCIWDLIMNHGLKMLSFFICELIERLKKQILKTFGNELNNLLKYNFKQTIKSINKEEMIENVKNKFKKYILEPIYIFSIEQISQKQQQIAHR